MSILVTPTHLRDVSQSTSSMTSLLVPLVNKPEVSLVNDEPSHLKTNDFRGVSELLPTTRQNVADAQETAFKLYTTLGGKVTWLTVEPFHNMRYGVISRFWPLKVSTDPVTKQELVDPQAMSFAPKLVGQPEVDTTDHEEPSHFVRKVSFDALMPLVCRPSTTDIQNEVETQETSPSRFSLAAGFDAVNDVTVSKSADAVLLVTATRPSAMATMNNADVRRDAGVMENVLKRNMSNLSNIDPHDGA